MLKKPISADSHITEPPNCYVDYIDPKFRDRAPRMKRLDKVGDAFVIEGMDQPVPMGLVAAAGKDPAQITTMGVAFEELWRSGWDSNYRVADQEKDGVAAEVSTGQKGSERPRTWADHATARTRSSWQTPSAKRGCG